MPKSIKLNSRGGVKPLLSLVLIILLALVLYLAVNLFFLKPDMYQAVFLDSGQVYFGKAQGFLGQFMTLKEVYYFGADQETPDSLDLTLIKLGTEIHGPENEMKILKNHVLFIQDLTPESRVIEAINSNQ